MTSDSVTGIIIGYILSKRSIYMRHFLKKLIPLLLTLGILFSVGWYFLVYDTTLTRDLLLRQAQKFEQDGNTTAAVWLYNLAYLQSGGDDTVAIELSEQFKAIGNYSQAEATLNRAIQDGGSVDVYIALCKTYVEQNKLRDAVAMLDKVGNKQIKEQLDAMRPEAPTASAKSGPYTQYLQVSFSGSNGTIYLSTDNDYPSMLTDAYATPLTLTAGETVVYAVTVAENGLVSPLAKYNYIIQNVVEEVFFTDGYIEASLRKQLQIPENRPIYSEMLWSVEQFTVPELAESCEDLKWLVNLESLTIEKAIFTDFSPLANLVNLRTLKVTETPIKNSDLAFLSGMKHLQSLTLSGCAISTIAELDALEEITYLDLSNNTIRNISSLSAMTMLEYLDLSNNALISLQALEKLTNLKTLDVSYNFLSSTSHVASLTALQELDVSSNNLMILEGIGSLTALRHFSAAYNNLIDVDILKSCILLQTLDVSHNTLLNIQVISGLVQLEELDFSYNEVSKLPEFNTNCALRIIRGEYNMLTSLDRLSGLRNLTHIYMDYNSNIANINSLRYCDALQVVHVYGTKVTDISTLADKGIMVHYTPKV